MGIMVWYQKVLMPEFGIETRYRKVSIPEKGIDTQHYATRSPRMGKKLFMRSSIYEHTSKRADGM